MARIVIAGVADCPSFARVEYLADKLAFNLPNFKVHKIIKLPDEWKEWLEVTCQERGWRHNESPLIWRELIDRGGKGKLIGNHNDFQEYLHVYYNILASTTSEEEKKVAKENLATAVEVNEEEFKRLKDVNPIKVCITGASNPICYGLTRALISGDCFGKESMVSLHLLDSKENMSTVRGLSMEAQDMASRSLLETKTFSSPDEAFKDCCYIIIVANEVPHNANESREVYLNRIREYFTRYGLLINNKANENVRIAVVGSGPVNSIVATLLHCCCKLSSNQILGVSQLIETRARGLLASRLKMNSEGVENVVVWGSVGGTHVVDASQCKVYRHDGAIWAPRPFSRPLEELETDKNWLEKELTFACENDTVEDPRFLEECVEPHTSSSIETDRRKQSLDDALRHDSSLSAAEAAATLIKLWRFGCEYSEQYHSVAIASQGWFGIPEGTVFSVPVQFRPRGSFTVMNEWKIPSNVQEQLPKMIQELANEMKIVTDHDS